ncbi:MAG: DUF4153 domain-containing protein [Sphingobacteriales bacterium]|nr:MAG: DUF4153 domain-containing protein [Sphingobacteriales bacterium]
MKIPSIQALWLQTTKVFLRFPLQFILAILATSTWWYLIGIENYRGTLEINLVKFLSISNLALTLLLASDLYAEVKQFEAGKKWIFRFMAIIICVGLFFTLHPSHNQADMYRIVILGFSFHLLVAFAPFIGNSNVNGFWHYNKTLFLRFLTSVLYAAVLYAGLAIALVAIDGLFNVTIDYRIYLKLFAVVGLCFTTVFFLAGVPDNINSLNQNQTYPKGLKIFTQYVLIPLVSIYLAILLVYEIKIALIWQLPKGLVSTLILGYAVFGILSLLLIYPIKNNEENGWIKLFGRFFYVMMLPLVLLLILAIIKRVGSYGITEPRYYLIILALWLSSITIYFLVSKHQNIKIIPISLCIMALLTVYGPQSAFSVAKIAQIARLKNLMQLKANTIDNEKHKASIIRYLVSNHGLTALQSFTHVNLTTIENKLDLKTKNNYENSYTKIDTAFAILKVKDINYSGYSTQLYAEKENKDVVYNSDFDFCILIKDKSESNNFINGTHIKIVKIDENLKKSTKNILSVTVDDEVTLDFNLNDSIINILQQCKSGKLKKIEKSTNYMIPNNELKFVKGSKNYTITFIITSINASYEQSVKGYSWLNFDGYLLFKSKK